MTTYPQQRSSTVTVNTNFGQLTVEPTRGSPFGSDDGNVGYVILTIVMAVSILSIVSVMTLYLLRIKVKSFRNMNGRRTANENMMSHRAHSCAVNVPQTSDTCQLLLQDAASKMDNETAARKQGIDPSSLYISTCNSDDSENGTEWSNKIELDGQERQRSKFGRQCSNVSTQTTTVDDRSKHTVYSNLSEENSANLNVKDEHSSQHKILLSSVTGDSRNSVLQPVVTIRDQNDNAEPQNSFGINTDMPSNYSPQVNISECDTDQGKCTYVHRCLFKNLLTDTPL